jgi:5-methylthioribose kinase
MATFGAPGYDLGTLAASLVMAAIASAARAAPDGGGSNSSHRRAWLEQAAWLLAAAEETVEVAIQNLGRDSRRRGSSRSSRSKSLERRGGGVDATAAAASLRQDALLFAAVAMCRLTVGGHKFDGFTSVPSYAQRVWCEHTALECGRELLCLVGSGSSNSMRVATDLVRAAIKAM